MNPTKIILITINRELVIWEHCSVEGLIKSFECIYWRAECAFDLRSRNIFPKDTMTCFEDETRSKKVGFVLLIKNSTISRLFFLEKSVGFEYHRKNTGSNMLSLEGCLGKRYDYCLNWNTGWLSSLITPEKKQTRSVVTSSEDAAIYILRTYNLYLTQYFFFCFQTKFCLVKVKTPFTVWVTITMFYHMKVIVLSGEWGCRAKSRIKAEN